MTMSTLLLGKDLNSFANDLKRLLDKGVDIVTIVNESLDVFKRSSCRHKHQVQGMGPNNPRRRIHEYDAHTLRKNRG